MTIYLELYFTLNNTSDKVHCKLGILTKMIAVPLVACSTSVKKRRIKLKICILLMVDNKQDRKAKRKAKVRLKKINPCLFYV